MKKIKFLQIMAICLTLSSFESCTIEYLPDCTSGSCVNVNIKGSVHVVPSGEKLNNKPVKIYFNGGMFGEFTYNIVSGKTDKNGEFNFNARIDTTHFNGSYRLYVAVSGLSDDYISERLKFSDDATYLSFGYFDENALKNIEFKLYKKAILTINVKRIQIDDTYLQVEYFYEEFWKTAFYPTKTEGIFQCQTAADTYTRVRWKKRQNEDFSTVEEGLDSLLCRQNKDNVFNINY